MLSVEGCGHVGACLVEAESTFEQWDNNTDLIWPIVFNIILQASANNSTNKSALSC